ncbi:hypothetical protein TNIN_297131 [Trichonephila inaurata madagascariensis]|uniref:Uncharacterized protein n=1 Tax=Trichonephila inaurata madagascariensis TaxID=2747483 RepID=A0A8X7C8H8_9ARAC|nr:hypothetical protein TNIN_297131 [Trichonephila inaurata madagascariensis]
MLSSGVIILQGNARSHATKMCVEALARKTWKALGHPAYCLNPANITSLVHRRKTRNSKSSRPCALIYFLLYAAMSTYNISVLKLVSARPYNS